jgi:Protein of unknown function (DUF2796)
MFQTRSLERAARRGALIVVVTACSSITAAHAAGHAHVHGVARLDVAVEPTRIVLQLSSPLDNLLGFERAPRTDEERKQAAAGVDRLRKPDLFQADPVGACTLKSATLASTALKLGNPDPAEEEAGHADIDGTFELACRDATAVKFIDVDLFQFARMQRVEVQVVTPRAQFKRELQRPARRIDLQARAP